MKRKDLKKHIRNYQSAKEIREQRISDLKKSIESENVLIQNLEEQNKDYDLIIRAYEQFVEAERKSADDQYYTDFDAKEVIEKMENHPN